MPDQTKTEIAFTQIRDVYNKCPFMQVNLMPLDDFVRFLDKRQLSFERDDIKSTFKQWLPPIDSGHDITTHIYHPYQAWIARRIVQIVTPPLGWASWWTGSFDRIDKHIRDHREYASKLLEDLNAPTEEFYELLLLLVKADPFCIPIIHQKVGLPLSSPGKDAYKEYLTWRHSFNIKTTLTESSLSIDKLKLWHEALSASAGMMNDAEGWYLLMRHAKFDKRDVLKNRIRLSFDFYEMAESLRILLTSVGEKLPSEDDYLGSGGFWKKGFYGVEEIDFAKRVVLKRLLREYNLDASYKLYWFVEGPTEYGFIKVFSAETGTNIEERGIALVNLGGTGDLTQRRKEVGTRLNGAQSFVELLRKLKADEVFTFITADDDQGVSEGFESLRKQGLLTGGFVKWSGDFEESNFSITELIEMLKGIVNTPIEITPEEIIKAKSKSNSAAKPRALGEALEAIARTKPGLEHFSKGEEWGKTLANYALNQPNMNGTLRPILKAFERAVDGADCDFRGSLDNIMCNPNGDMVARPKTAIATSSTSANRI